MKLNRSATALPPDKRVREKTGNPLGNQQVPKRNKDTLTVPTATTKNTEGRKPSRNVDDRSDDIERERE